MSIYVEHKYVSSNTGLNVELTCCETIDEAVRCIREATKRPGWSDSVLVNGTSLPAPARDSWQRRKSHTEAYLRRQA
mgnify:CR=1 FL=1